MPVYDLKIQPRDRELIAATHGRGFWIVPVAALEAMTPKMMANAPVLFAPTTAYQWSEGPTLGIPGNGHGQQPLVIPAPAYGASIDYYLASKASDTVRVVVTDAVGDTLYRTTGPGTPGMHTVTWSYQAASAATPREQSPSERRDSILLNVRAPMVLDSLRKAGFDSAAVARVRRQVTQARNPSAAGGGFRFNRGGGNTPEGCEHPLTQWDTFCERPAEPPRDTAQAGGRRGGGRPEAEPTPSGAPGLDPVQRIWDVIGMRQPAAPGRGGFFRGFGGSQAEPGTYLVTLTVDGKRMTQPLRIERVGGGGDAGSPFEEEDRER